MKDGLVDERQARALTERYELDRLGAEAHGVLMNTIFLIGVVLIACGVVAFVAAHWGNIPKAVKLAMLMAAMLAAHAGGWYLWHVRKTPKPYIGHALVVLGTLIFGANIALFAQVFHISEAYYNGFMAWALGAALIAYAARSVPNAVIAVLTSFVWFCGYVDENHGSFWLYPVLAASVFLPAAYLWRSYTVFVLAVLALVVALVTNTAFHASSASSGLLAFLIPPVALWACGVLHRPDGRWPGFGLVARWLGVIGVAGVAYVFSFHEMAQELGREVSHSFVRRFGESGEYALGVLMSLAPAAVALALGLMNRRKTAWFVLVVAVIMAGAAFLPEPETWATVAYNVVSVSLAGLGIAIGVAQYRRAPYWAGLVFLVVLIVSRFFEYESHLMIKSAGFIASGAALIYAGLKFERRMRDRLTGGAKEASDA